MDYYHELLDQFLKRHKRNTLVNPDHLMWLTNRPRKKTLGERYIEALEAEGDVEKVTKKFIAIGTREPGATKERVALYLEACLKRAQKEGRL